MSIDLPECLESDTDNDKETGAPEVKLHIKLRGQNGWNDAEGG
jgi:hypothetical protein